MVASQSSSLAPAKKQQSILSFFTKNPTSRPPPALTPQTSNVSNGTFLADKDESLFIGSDEDTNTHPNGRRSSSTPKYAYNDGEHYNNGDSVELPARKRMRLSGSRKESQGTPSDNHLISMTANEIRNPKPPQSTSKYTFSSSPNREEENVEEDDDETQRRKERLHEKFVKKLGRPESIAEIKRRNWVISEETAQDRIDGNEDEDAEEDAMPETATKGRKGARKLTPMRSNYWKSSGSIWILSWSWRLATSTSSGGRTPELLPRS